MSKSGRTIVTSAALALAMLCAPPGDGAFTSPVLAQQADALAAYNNALNQFKAVLAERGRQINSRQPLPNLPGQALYLARNNLMSTYKDLTDAQPSQIGRPNKLGIPPQYFDADNEPLIDEYRRLFEIMQAAPADAQNSATPFQDVVDLGSAIARAKGLDAANAEAAGRISLGCSLPKPTATRTSEMRARTNTRAAFRPAYRKMRTAARNGRRSSRRSPRSIPN